ncbi:ABC transporter ATP-binding protein [Corynebacterium parakroppenstedtii]|uniref:ABC transporter ATP-binding protein n=1 Tax=Corynebacterium parakroppenstedtii TaxID=2828363 RepID=UPI001C8F28F6|nr:ABC transporter ATP-binding protein [Corynebacterium parakroppenstedtii]MBY0793958.1 ABC transporter ATP-binding protein [Corynebacterium parakroppenstedtii]
MENLPDNDTASDTPTPSPHAPHVAPLADDPTSCAMAFRNLYKSFRGKPAVNQLNLDIPRGSFYGLVGPNGAGKTTAITMSTGLLRPDQGSVWVNGINVWDKPAAAKATFGLLADGLPTFDRLSGKELLQFSGALRGMDEGIVEKRANELLDVLDLKESANKIVADYSAGMTKKILLAQALIHRPELLILDEPLEAVDPVSAQIIRSILTTYVKAGGTVIMSSHVMEVVEGLCDHVAIMQNGRVLASGTTDEVRNGSSLTDTFLNLVGGGRLAEGSLGWLAS